MMLLMYLMFIIAMNNKLNYSRYIITFNSYYLEMWATEWFLKWEIKILEERIRELEERIRFLEQCLDNKEKVNKSLREELKELNKMMLFETELEK